MVCDKLKSGHNIWPKLREMWLVINRKSLPGGGDLQWPKGVSCSRGGTQYKSGYRDVPQTWVAKSGRQVHQWVPFFSKTWYFDGSIFQNFLNFAPKWRKFGTLVQNGANFSEKFWFLVHGWVTFPSKWVHGWVAFQKSQRHTPTQTKVEYPPGDHAQPWTHKKHPKHVLLGLKFASLNKYSSGIWHSKQGFFFFKNPKVMMQWFYP